MREINFSSMYHIFVIPRGLRGHSLLKAFFHVEVNDETADSTGSSLVTYTCIEMLTWEVNDAGALEIRWTVGYLVPQEPTEIAVYSHGEVIGDDDEIPEMDNKIENRSDPRLLLNMWRMASEVLLSTNIPLSMSTVTF